MQIYAGRAGHIPDQRLQFVVIALSGLKRVEAVQILVGVSDTLKKLNRSWLETQNVHQNFGRVCIFFSNEQQT